MARIEQHDEMDEMEDEETGEDTVELQDDVEEDASPVLTSKRDESAEEAEARTVAARERVRQELSRDVEAFLARGGKINQVAPNVVADPPRKPEGDYGSRPL
ncbi:MAG TPA: hypothetical protein VL027_03070 [Spongiibacteraceae bacterium]|jgi:hypothetical protein|nr:hypothetical protein [Spongiibacteraceae bacterium]HUH36907.1 hypothetical protein [Spongiibacteraceae bacterium]